MVTASPPLTATTTASLPSPPRSRPIANTRWRAPSCGERSAGLALPHATSSGRSPVAGSRPTVDGSRVAVGGPTMLRERGLAYRPRLRADSDVGGPRRRGTSRRT